MGYILAGKRTAREAGRGVDSLEGRMGKYNPRSLNPISEQDDISLLTTDHAPFATLALQCESLHTLAFQARIAEIYTLFQSRSQHIRHF